jgi:pimeloyl-ACP methyl ester carboxylesterase
MRPLPVRVRIDGPDDAPPVVLEPGLGASSLGWSGLHAQLARSSRVVSYDRAGLGASPSSPGHRDLTALTADLAEVISTAGAGPVVLVGHSLGATIARYLAHRQPDLVAGLVLVDPIPDAWVLRHARWARPAGALMYLAMQTIAHVGLIDALTALPPGRAIVRSSTSPLAALTGDERLQLAAEMRRPAHHQTARREFTGLLDSQAELRALATRRPAVPLTVLSGTRTHALAKSLRAKATDWHAWLAEPGRHVVVPDGDHFIPRCRPEIVCAEVAELQARVTVLSRQAPWSYPLGMACCACCGPHETQACKGSC